MQPIETPEDFLEKLLSTFLIDITNAQNASNINSANLAVLYSNPGALYPACLKYFPLPVPVIKSFEFTFQFAFQGFDDYINNILFGELKQVIEQFFNNSKQVIQPGDAENMVQEFFEKAKAELIRLLLNVTQKNEVIQQYSIFLKSLVADVVKRRYPQIKEESMIDLKNIREGLEKALTDFNQPLKDLKKAFKDIKVVYDVNTLNNLTSDVLCSLKVNVEMQNLQLGFEDNGLSANHDEHGNQHIKLV